MPGRQTTIRLIDAEDAPAIAEHRSRDATTFAPWEPEQPERFHTVGGQRDRIEQLPQTHRDGTTRPGVVLADGALAGQVTVGTIGLHRAEASTGLENLASQQVLRRNGFRPYGVAREHIFLDGEWRDGLLWEPGLGT